MREDSLGELRPVYPILILLHLCHSRLARKAPSGTRKKVSHFGFWESISIQLLRLESVFVSYSLVLCPFLTRPHYKVILLFIIKTNKRRAIPLENILMSLWAPGVTFSCMPVSRGPPHVPAVHLLVWTSCIVNQGWVAKVPVNLHMKKKQKNKPWAKGSEYHVLTKKKERKKDMYWYAYFFFYWHIVFFV